MNNKIKNQFLLKHGAYNAALIAIVLAIIVGVNVLATVLAERFPTDIDLSVTKANSISEENAEYIEGIDKKINIVVCATESGYVGNVMATYAQEVYQTQADTDFFKQTQLLLDQYHRYNNKITIEYVDPDTAAFSKVSAIVPDTSLYYGDILVYCTFKNAEGKEITNARVISFTDMYTLEDPNGYAAYGGFYNIASSNLETALTSAIYSATSEKSNTLALLSGHSKEGAFATMLSTLELNNYEVVEVKDAILKEIPKEADIIALVAPQKDLAASEIEVIEKFLENGGEKGKNLLVFCDGTKTGFPNLYAFLAEWGAELQDGKIVYETDDAYQNYFGPTTAFLTNKKTDYTATINGDNSMYVASNITPMQAAYTTFGNRVANVLFTTADTSVAAPMAEIANWTPSSTDKKESFAFAIYTHDTVYEADLGAKSSGVYVCASANFLSADWKQFNDVGNVNSVLAVINEACGRDASDIFFDQKIVENHAFSPPSLSAVKFVRVLFVFVLPILIMGAGIFVWLRRSRR
ncbi:MAG: GldG family protein [Clostridia bacterium]|nr:GldG family protein [Clostridia bacterium]